MQNLIYKYCKFSIFFLVFSFKTNDILSQVIAQDGTKYNVVTIGGREWLKTNLNVTTFANGTPIIQTKTKAEWETAINEKRPAYCYYDYNDSNGIKYGKLYNWYAINNAANLAPVGWHIPNDNDWKELVEALGGDMQIVSPKLKSKKGWEKYGKTSGNGNNKSGFSAIPGGGLRSIYFTFYGIGIEAYFWSSTYRPNGQPTVFTLRNSNNPRNETHGFDEGYSVRCVRNN